MLSLAGALVACSHGPPVAISEERVEDPTAPVLMRSDALEVVLPPAGSAPGAQRWNGDAPPTGTITQLVVCGGKQALNFVGRTFRVAHGPALIIGGSCVVTLTDCTIVADETDDIGAVCTAQKAQLRMNNTEIHGDVGLFAAGTSTVEMRGGSLRGVRTAISAVSDSEVSMQGVTMGGDVQQAGRAVIHGL